MIITINKDDFKKGLGKYILKKNFSSRNKLPVGKDL